MVKKVLICLMFLIMISLTFAKMEFNPSISIKNGEADEPIILRLIDTDTGKKFKTISMELDSTGRALVDIETNKKEILIYILHVYNLSSFTDRENIKKIDVAGPFPTSKAMIIDLENLAYDEETNNAEELNSTITENSNEEILIDESNGENKPNNSPNKADSDGNAPVTGAAVDNSEFSIKPTFYYIGIGAIILALVLFLVFKKGRSLWGKGEDKEIRAMEEKVRKVGEEIKRIQERKQKMSEVKKRLSEEEKELRELEDNEN